MKNYQELMEKILSQGTDKNGRNGWTRGVFAEQLRFDLSLGFPAVTTKRLAFTAMKCELLWFLMGSRSLSDLRRLTGKDQTIWDHDTHRWESFYKRNNDDTGKIYGVQWRQWGMKGIDQIKNLVQKLRTDKNDRRMIVTAWNPDDLDQMCLPACHVMFQCWVSPANKLSLSMVQRSCDMFLGVPFNIASYALLTHMLAQVCNLEVGELVVTLQDAHIYHKHFEAVETQLKREPRKLPNLWLNPVVKELNDFTIDDIQLKGYDPHEAIKAEIQ
jgi:thymidylate synthase